MFTIFFRTIILYLFIIFGIRLLGKRQVGELEPSELVLSFLIADLASVPMQDLGFPLHTGLIPILTLLALSSILSILTLKNTVFRNIFCGKPSVVIRNGQIDQKEMSKNRLTIDELLEELRVKGFLDLKTIQYAVLESNGQLSVLPFPENLPVTVEQMEDFSEKELKKSQLGLPRILISDGKLIPENLKLAGYDQKWLERKLKKLNHSSMKNIFLFIIHDDGSFYLAEKQEVN